MFLYKKPTIVIVLIGLSLATGCAGTKPPRFDGLTQLGMFIGHWEGTCETTMPKLDRPMHATSINDIEWDLDGRILVQHGQHLMTGNEMPPILSLGVWVYDEQARVYQTHWFTSAGSLAVGTMTYDPGSRTWHMTGRSEGPGGKTRIENTITFVDDDTMEWIYTEWAGMGLKPIAVTSGTSIRR